MIPSLESVQYHKVESRMTPQNISVESPNDPFQIIKGKVRDLPSVESLGKLDKGFGIMFTKDMS
jgi:hypothetical protein